MSATKALARAVSILGHPMLVMPVAAGFAARQGGVGAQSTFAIIAGLAVLGMLVLAYSAWSVSRGRWQHVDASAPAERSQLNRFLLGLFSVAAVVALCLPAPARLALAFALSAAIILLALGLARWCKPSLHVAFVAFAALVPGQPVAVAAFCVLGLAVAWSRLALGRHVWPDLGAGLLAGVAAGIVFRAF
jgi:hypothetical protein